MMQLTNRLLVVSYLMIVTSAAHPSFAGSVRSTTHSTHAATSRAAVKLDTGLVIVPFAVPVAVPVATVAQPSVLYSYRQYAPAYAPAAAASLGADSPPPAATKSNEPLDAAGILVRRCAQCHTGAAAQGQMQLFQSSGEIVSKLPRQAIVDAVERGTMPKPANVPRLTEPEIEALRHWARPPRDLAY
jgi:mono/diheme cytochrome c family protein